MYCLTGLNRALLGLALMITLYPELVLTQQASIKCDTLFWPGYDPTVTLCDDANKIRYQCQLATCKINNAPWDKFSFQNCKLYMPNSQQLDPSPPVAPTAKLVLYLGNEANQHIDVQTADLNMYQCLVGSPTDPNMNSQRAICSGCKAI